MTSESYKGWKPVRGDPWCWQPKAALRRIREALDAENAVASGLLVYVALTEIASDKQSQTFQATHLYIAGRTGLSPRTVQQRIQALTSIGVLKCVVPALRAPATYTLLAINPKADEQPLPRVPQPLLNEAQRLHDDEQPLPSVMQRSKNAPLPTLEESNEESGKNQGNKPPVLKLTERISFEKELSRVDKELGKLGSLSDHDKGGKTYKRIEELTARQAELRKILGVIV